MQVLPVLALPTWRHFKSVYQLLDFNPENILIAMITDDQNFIKELGLRRIMAARARKSIGLRKYTILDFNFEVEDYHELIDWQNWGKNGNSTYMGISDAALKQIVVDGVTTEVFDFQN
ncbi:hypothetical protein AVEN_133914-1 [Araneus ventricosus]|uniref:Uncharacterized protein n=1 Tax=Araneus ventricosus TaxID=182803 RepID=A0A4Y2D4F1_ARAVE|nr:hypothetical protein AVEN_133914-1 [Araneus ventricosus]